MNGISLSGITIASGFLERRLAFRIAADSNSNGMNFSGAPPGFPVRSGFHRNWESTEFSALPVRHLPDFHAGEIGLKIGTSEISLDFASFEILRIGLPKRIVTFHQVFPSGTPP